MILQKGGIVVMRPKDAKMPARAKVYWLLLLLGFMIMEFPGILFYQDRATPTIFGFPFIYAFTLIMWAYMVVVLFIAVRDNWGEPKVGEKAVGGGEISES